MRDGLAPADFRRLPCLGRTEVAAACVREWRRGTRRDDREAANDV